MPRFPAAFGRRKSTAENLENASVATPSFRVLDRTEVGVGKSFDGGTRLAVKAQTMPTMTISDAASIDDNIFADLKTNRGSGSGSSNTTKTTSTDNSSRHSNASTAPSTADIGGQDDWKAVNKRAYADIPIPPIPKSSSAGFMKSSGRSWSFGRQKKHLPPLPVAEEPVPETPSPPPTENGYSGRARATTTSTVSTATPPKLEQDFTLDLGGDFGNMILGLDKRTSVATVRDDAAGRPALAPRSLTGNRLNQPPPIQIDRNAKVEASPYSWSSQNSNDQLLSMSPGLTSSNENTPPALPRHGSPLAGRPQVPAPSTDNSIKRTSAVFGKRRSATEGAEAEDEDSRLLKDSLSTVGKFLSTQTPTGRYRRNEDSLGSSYRQVSAQSTPSRFDGKGDDDSLFDTSLAQSSRMAQRYVSRKPSPPRNKVMTPAQFERYRQDKERQDTRTETAKPEPDNNDDDDDNYEDDEDEIEKSKQAAKQRRKQEAHMTVYRQQMMKVTGESNGGSSRPSMQMSFSTPNLGNVGGISGTGTSPTAGSDGSDEDEEVPLAILAAHGFPNKNRPPTRLSTMMSNPNLRATAGTPSYQRPGSVVGDAAGANNGGRLPPFARNLPQDPYLGAGLVNSSVRESLAFGGGAPAPAQAPTSTPVNSYMAPGGLVGVIANEERSRAMRRGSPAVDPHKPMLSMNTAPQFDPVMGIPHQMMYGGMPPTPVLTPGDQAQIQMTQQMQQFMQMQMQFMQMMAANGGGGGGVGLGMPRPPSQMLAPGMATPDTLRHSFIDNGSVMDLSLTRPDMHARSMSMVQPSSASWIQPPAPAGYAPSIRVQGANGYAPSIAPSERSNIGLPGRYRPVSQAPPPVPTPGQLPKSTTMSGALGGWDPVRRQSKSPLQKSGSNSDDDEEEAWEAMRAKREKKKSIWRSKKSLGSELGALIH